MQRQNTIRQAVSAALVLAASAGMAAASASYFDGVFNPWDWNEITFTNSIGVGSTSSAFQMLVGGNLDEYRQVNLGLVASAPGGAVFSLNVNANAFYNPGTQGAITFIDYSEDSINLLDNSGDGQGSGLLVIQNGTIYIQRNPILVMPHPAFSLWAQNAAPGLVAGDLWEIMPNGFLDSTSNPDFSAAGGVMQLGFWRGASSGNAVGDFSRLAGIDNWSVRIVPTPGALLMLAPAGLLTCSRRRR